jgi:hypothetical protein
MEVGGGTRVRSVFACGVGLGSGGGGPGGCATRGQTDIRGLGTAGPGFVVRARCLGLGSSVTAGAAAHSRTAGALARGGQAGSAASSAERWGVGGSRLLVVVGDRPAEAGEVSGDGDRDDRAAFAALVIQAAPDLVHSRRWAFQEIATAIAGCRSWRRCSMVPMRGGRR